MSSFKERYRKLFRDFGAPLSKTSGVELKVIAAAEKRLGVKVPTALRDYYLVAGRERRFNQCHNRLLPPTKWSIDQGRLLFMEENQAVVWWGVVTNRSPCDDPPVWQRINCEPIERHSECRKVSKFLTVMLHYQAVSGGMKFGASADAPQQTDYRFEKHGWANYGEVGGVIAYSRANQVICLTPPSGLPWAMSWTVMAAGKTKRDLQAIADEIGVVYR